MTVDAFLCDALRTPFGTYGGALSGIRPDDLAALVVRELLNRHDQLDPVRVDEQDAMGATQGREALPDRQRHPGLHDARLALVNPQMPKEWTVSLGEATEMLCERDGIQRFEQDEFALRSHQAAARAWGNGFYGNQVVFLEGVDLKRDESIRTDTSIELLRDLKPIFREEGTVTAGNARVGPGTVRVWVDPRGISWPQPATGSTQSLTRGCRASALDWADRSSRPRLSR